MNLKQVIVIRFGTHIFSMHLPAFSWQCGEW